MPEKNENVLVKEQYLQDIADAIRTKMEETTTSLEYYEGTVITNKQ